MDKYQRLQKLSELMAAGVLSEEEFAAQKQFILQEQETVPSEDFQTENPALVGGLAVGIVAILAGLSDLMEAGGGIRKTLITVNLAGFVCCWASFQSKSCKTGLTLVALCLNLIGVALLLTS